MAGNPAIQEAQELNSDELIELYELDTAPLFMVNGVPVAGAQTYRWTSGIADFRMQGRAASSGTLSTTVVTLDRIVPIAAGRTYNVVVGLPDGSNSSSIQVSGFTTVAIPNPSGPGTINVTQISLSLPLSAVPNVGAAWTVYGTNLITFRANDYQPLPIEATGFEWNGQGKLPRPKIRISNIGGLAAALIIAYGDLLGAKVTRIRTFRNFLDDGTEADPTAFFDPDVFFIDRKSSHNKAYVEFELAAILDQQGKRIPGRIMLRDSCGQIYRQYVTDAGGVTGFVPGTCPYAGSAYFKADGTSTSDPAQDVCGLLLSDCVLRFGEGTPLPMLAFPGLAAVKT